MRVHGTLVPLLELGLGFQQELSVRENVELYGAVLGYSRATMARRIDEVVAFAGLERFRDAKLKSLSSGMVVRLAFDALRADADTLLLDEVPPSVTPSSSASASRSRGDSSASARPSSREPRRRLRAALLRARVLARQGRLVLAGEANEVIQTYLAVAQAAAAARRPWRATRRPSIAGETASCASPT